MRHSMSSNNKQTQDKPLVKLVSTTDSEHCFDVIGIDDVTSATVPNSIKAGGIFNIYYAGGTKVGGIWQGKRGISDYLIGELERAIIASNNLVKKPAIAGINT